MSYQTGLKSFDIELFQFHASSYPHGLRCGHCSVAIAEEGQLIARVPHASMGGVVVVHCFNCKDVKG